MVNPVVNDVTMVSWIEGAVATVACPILGFDTRINSLEPAALWAVRREYRIFAILFLLLLVLVLFPIRRLLCTFL